MEENIILNIDKPAGITSCRVVERIKKNFFPHCKVGHAGTLDPSATGILLICVGKATKKFSEILKLEKEYRGDMVLGISTDTADADGKVLQKKDASYIEKDAIERVFKKFKGIVKQVPPMYSALRHNGRHLYELAREGKIVKRQARDIHIYEFKMLDFIPGQHPVVSFSVVCSSGTYVRALAEEVGSIFGCGAYLSKLERTRIGNYLLKDSLKIEDLKNTLSS